ncbi:MAG: hypothetical protein ABW252_20170 [Polyangiales bacterium]
MRSIFSVILLISAALSACDSPRDSEIPSRVDETLEDGEVRWSFSSSGEGISAQKAVGGAVVSSFLVDRGEQGEVVVTQDMPTTKTVVLREDSGAELLSVDPDFAELLARAGDLTNATVPLEKADVPGCGFGRRDSCGLFVKTCQDLLPSGEPCTGWYDCGWCFGIW